MTADPRVNAVPAYSPDGFWDEMFEGPGQVRPHYVLLARRLATLAAPDVAKRQRAADLSFQAQGITFAVNQDASGPEKTMPFDLVPRIVLAEEWSRIERGLEQRVRALNLFLHDIYHDQKILRNDLIPAELVLGARGYRREFRDVDVPLGVYTHVVGSDLVRDGQGTWYVLEDNLRVPSGVSYVVENRRVLKRVWPQLFADYRVRPVEGYPQDLLEVLRSVAQRSDDPTVVLLTPGVHNSAFFEHAFLAKSMGIDLVQGSDLFVDDAAVYMRTTRGRRRVDVIYRRVDDEFLDPLAFRADSLLGIPGLLATCRMGRVTLANAIGTGVADDKAIYAYVPTIIKYYLGEDEVLPNVKTYIADDPSERAYILEHIAELVVKSVNESGGYGMLIGPHAPKADLDEYRARVEQDPRGYVAQPTLALSRHPTWSVDHLEGRHVDLRPFILSGRDIKVTPGGLTRVALRSGSLVVNSSQGGGAKDTWVLE
ncbi:MAG: circularly permuted type 2 ATP-grasp protein [Chloroflexota bacterium]|nr:circularly permuted type 2 ATP-grasp protein [Chloroflexota bacterium]